MDTDTVPYWQLKRRPSMHQLQKTYEFSEHHATVLFPSRQWPRPERCESIGKLILRFANQVGITGQITIDRAKQAAGKQNAPSVEKPILVLAYEPELLQLELWIRADEKANYKVKASFREESPGLQERIMRWQGLGMPV